jgi:hypothetical protein
VLTVTLSCIAPCIPEGLLGCLQLLIPSCYNAHTLNSIHVLRHATTTQPTFHISQFPYPLRLSPPLPTLLLLLLLSSPVGA